MSCWMGRLYGSRLPPQLPLRTGGRRCATSLRCSQLLLLRSFPKNAFDIFAETLHTSSALAQIYRSRRGLPEVSATTVAQFEISNLVESHTFETSASHRQNANVRQTEGVNLHMLHRFSNGGSSIFSSGGLDFALKRDFVLQQRSCDCILLPLSALRMRNPIVVI